MAYIEDLDMDMIRYYLDGAGWDYTEDDNGFNVTGLEEGGHSCGIRISVQDGSMCGITAVSGKDVPKEDWGRAMMLCNQWNQEKAIGKVYLDYSDDDEPGSLVYENYQVFSEGIHQDHFDTYAKLSIGGALNFFEWILDDKGL